MTVAASLPGKMALFLLLLLSVFQAKADFLSAIKVPNPSRLAQVGPPAVRIPSEVTQVVQSPRQIAEGLKGTPALELHSEGLKVRSEDLKAQAEQGVTGLQQMTSAALETGADLTSNAKPQDVQNAFNRAIGPGPGREAQQIVETLPTQSPSGFAAALSGATSRVAEAVNQTSSRAADALRSMGPRAAALLNRTGHEVAGHLSGHQASNARAGSLLPFDVMPMEAPEKSWAAFCGAVLLLIIAGCGAFVGHQRHHTTGRKGPIMLSEALAPLAASHARTPVLQNMTPQDALLRAD